jgi:hypothetical protein
LVEGRFDIDRIPQHNHIDHESQRAQLILLPFPVALAQLAALTMENYTGETVPPFTAIELS